MNMISKIAAASTLAVVLMCLSTNAAPGGHGSRGSSGSSSSGSTRSHDRGYSYDGGQSHSGNWHHEGYRGYEGRHWGYSSGWPWYGYDDFPYYPYDYYSYPPTYSPPSAVYSSPDPSAPNSPAPTLNDELVKPAPQPQATPPARPMSVADVKALVKAGIAVEVVISQIAQSRMVFRLTTAEIIDLKESGVSNKIIEFMVNTPSRQGQ